MDLPYQQDVHDAVLEYTASVSGRFKNVVVLGIGGSALGNTALHAALSSPFHDLAPPPGYPRLFVLDNVDPDLVGEWLDHFDPAETLFNVISKSGGTAETMSQFLLFRGRLVEALGEEGHREHIVVTTDETKGILREIVEREGYQSFVVPDGVGGRFSVLSPVGLVSSALVGIDIKGVLAGAAAMDELVVARDSGKHWFLGVGFERPHRPWNTPREFYDLYPNSGNAPTDIALATNKLGPLHMPEIAWISNKWPCSLERWGACSTLDQTGHFTFS